VYVAVAARRVVDFTVISPAPIARKCLLLERLHHGHYLIAVSHAFTLCLRTVFMRIGVVRALEPKVEHVIFK
jgi:hypothetical protein